MDATAVRIELKLDRETKHTVRYAEAERDDGLPPAIGTLYLQKWQVKLLGDPETITVEILGAS
jgi:hypothetical protein